MHTFTAKYIVTIGDINYGGHMGNERALVVFQDARLYFLRSIEASEMDIGAGCGIIMVESGVRYLREVFLHDELTIAVWVSEVRKKKFTLEYSVSRMADAAEVFSGFTSFLSFNYGSRKVVALPESFQRNIATYLREGPS